jgi:hypothetical protein
LEILRVKVSVEVVVGNGGGKSPERVTEGAFIAKKKQKKKQSISNFVSALT